MRNEFSEIQVTFDQRETAEKVGRLLVERYLVACAQVSGPVTSCYRWKGKIETAEEWVLTVKTRTCLFDEVAEVVAENHPYEVPQIVAVPMTEIRLDYEKWLGDQIH